MEVVVPTIYAYCSAERVNGKEKESKKKGGNECDTMVVKHLGICTALMFRRVNGRRKGQLEGIHMLGSPTQFFSIRIILEFLVVVLLDNIAKSWLYLI